jgi:hypothetical protein
MKNTVVDEHNPKKLAGTTSQRRLGIGSGTVREIAAPTVIDARWKLSITFLCGIFTNFLETVRPVQPSNENFISDLVMRICRSNLDPR